MVRYRRLLVLSMLARSLNCSNNYAYPAYVYAKYIRINLTYSHGYRILRFASEMDDLANKPPL